MALHLIRMAVGTRDLDHLRSSQLARPGRPEGILFGHTKRMPTRTAELLDGGSLYWVIKGQVAVRQSFRAFESITDPEGGSMTRLHLAEEWIRVVPLSHRPFQGWRYLKPENAPADLDGAGDVAEMPAAMVAELRDLGIL